MQNPLDVDVAALVPLAVAVFVAGAVTVVEDVNVAAPVAPKIEDTYGERAGNLCFVGLTNREANTHLTST